MLNSWKTVSTAISALTASTLSVLLVSCGPKETTTQNASDSNKAGYAKKSGSLSETTCMNLPRLGKKEVLAKYLPGAEDGQLKSLHYLTAANKANSSCDYESGVVLAAEAIRLSPSSPEAFYQRARALLYSPGTDNSQALSDLKKTVALVKASGKPQPLLTGQSYVLMARIYDSRSQPAQALAVMDEAILESPGNKALYKVRAAVRVSQGQKKQALEDYNAWIRLAPADGLPRILRGQLLETMGRYEEALRDYDFGTRLTGKTDKIEKVCPAFKFKALLLSRLGRHKEALALLSEALKKVKSEDELYVLRAKEHAALKNYDSAIADYSEAIEIAPTFSVAALEGRAGVYKLLGKEELANRDLLEAKETKEAPAEKELFELKR
jgi:tetratricopeptide (TPR) repeat protein